VIKTENPRKAAVEAKELITEMREAFGSSREEVC
jgi:hypothetical protein